MEGWIGRDRERSVTLVVRLFLIPGDTVILESLRDLPGRPGGVGGKNVSKKQFVFPGTGPPNLLTESLTKSNTQPRLQTGRDAKSYDIVLAGNRSKKNT
jgi:hypothetical protein